MKRESLRIVGLVLCFVFICGLARAQSFNFTYQGKLDDAGAPANGIYDFRFSLFDISSGGTPLVSNEQEDVQVTNGVFSVELSFGVSAFPADAFRVLEIAVRPGASAGAYTALAPRQQILSVPYSIRSRYAATADNASQLGGIGAGGFLRNTSSAQFVDLTIVGNSYFNGNLGVGFGTFGSPLRLDVKGRARFGQNNNDTGATNSAGFWLYQNAPATDRAFVGMQDDSHVGLFGNNGAGWGLTMNTATGNVGIGNPNSPDKLNVNGNVSLLLASGGGTSVCQNASFQLATCGSSLRYKTNIAPFFSGLSFIRQLRPITFDWIQNRVRDVGLGAEDVAKIDPLFVTYNDKGQVEGVKYDRIGVVAINAIKEQQAEIETLRKENMRERQRLDALTDLVCSLRPKAAMCKVRR